MLSRINFILIAGLCIAPLMAADLHLNDLDYFETQGLSVLAYQNTFHPVFRDQKLGGVEIILHGERIATDGEIRLLPTPEQWDPVPTFTSRKHGSVPDQLIAYSGYPDLSFVVATTINQTGQAVEGILILMGVFLSISLSVSLFMNWYNRRAMQWQR